ncbi:helix-turn-helix transcriptional regulator [Sinomonas sp. G460-2]|uniref:helix-turn-helix transcriptional regulator n=1 Tax=Sinomonas sp. G460-2 TaxID=3393464 RepID=UPI0039EF9AA7
MSGTTEHGIAPVEPLWRAREVSEFLNVSQATLSRWRRERVGPPFLQVGGVSRYNPAAVRAWVCDQEAAHG